MKAYIEENQLQSPTPMPYIQQYEQLAFGMFVHLGLYSGLAQGEWTYQIHGVSKYDYEELQSRFQFESFDEIVQTAS